MSNGGKPGGFPSEQQLPSPCVGRSDPTPSPQGDAECWGLLRTSFQDSLSPDILLSHLVALDLKQLLQWKKPIISRHQADYLKKGNLHCV